MIKKSEIFQYLFKWLLPKLFTPNVTTNWLGRANSVQRRALDTGSKFPGFESRSSQLEFPVYKGINRHCYVAQFAGNAQ